MKVLVIDDSKFMRKSLALKLKKKGMKVFQAEDGRQGIEMAGKVKPHMILLDLIMPGMNGFETCEKLRKIEGLEHVPVIMVTVKSDEKSVKKAMKAGATDYVVKPVNSRELFEKMEKCLVV